LPTPPPGLPLTAVREPHRFDEGALGDYLAARLPDLLLPLSVWQFEGGQSNPTYLLEDGRGQRLVLRKKPPGTLLPSAHLVEREYRVMSALCATAVPVPRMVHLCEDQGVVGTAFFVMEFIDGRVLRDPSLPGLLPAERAATYDAMNAVIAGLHAVDYRALGLEDFGKPAQYLARQVSRWNKQWLAARTEPIPAMDWLAGWLADHLPPEEPPVIAHGDLRLDNLLFHEREPRVLALIDWELATIGDPLADLAYSCLPYHLPSLGRGLSGLAGVDLAELGIPSEAEYVAAYCRRTGRPGIAHFGFFLAFGLFRLASIAQGVQARALQGSASSSRARDVGQLAAMLAQLGQRLAREGAAVTSS
jgi:aminoglycoside phosphotransferase (APT) family kinase protein